MWQPWGKPKILSGKVATPTPSSSSSIPSFTKSKSTSSFTPFSSLKDVHSLLQDDGDIKWLPCPKPSAPATPRPPSPGPVFNRVRSSASTNRLWQLPASSSSGEDLFGVPHGEEKRVVVYFTSLRAVRKTSEDCRAVLSIFQGFRVAVDERDVSMDAAYLVELKGLLGRRGKHQQRHPSLPQVFIGGRHVGGADEIRQLNETGELKRYVEGVKPVAAVPCEGCSDARFLVCGRCSGSCKCFADKGPSAGGFRSCTACNENGLVRCPQCN